MLGLATVPLPWHRPLLPASGALPPLGPPGRARPPKALKGRAGHGDMQRSRLAALVARGLWLCLCSSKGVCGHGVARRSALEAVRRGQPASREPAIGACTRPLGGASEQNDRDKLSPSLLKVEASDSERIPCFARRCAA